MGFIYGLAVFLIIFEGIIIHCEGTPRRGQPLSTQERTQLEGMEEIVPSYLARAKYNKMCKIVEKSLIDFTPSDYDISGTYDDYEPTIFIGKYRELSLFFGRFGDQVKKIRICSGEKSDTECKIDTVQTMYMIFGKCVNNLEELRIDTDDKAFWNALLVAKKNRLQFPVMKNLLIIKHRERNELKFNSIFPHLQSLQFEFRNMNGFSAIENLPSDMPHLKELILGQSGYENLDDNRIIKFIQHFGELQKLGLFFRYYGYDAVKCIKKLTHIKEFMAYYHEDYFESLTEMFKSYNGELQTLMLEEYELDDYENYEELMAELNIDAERTRKPKWTMSYEENTQELMFKR